VEGDVSLGAEGREEGDANILEHLGREGQIDLRPEI